MGKDLKASLIMRHRPDLLGELRDLNPPEEEDIEALKAFWEQIHGVTAEDIKNETERYTSLLTMLCVQ